MLNTDNNKKFQIIVTINPGITTKEILNNYIDNGATFIRINGAFNNLSLLYEQIQEIQEIIKGKCKILLDLPGFKIRLSNIDEKIFFRKDEPFKIRGSFLNYPKVLDYIKEGEKIRANDGMNIFKVKYTEKNSIVCVSEVSGELTRGRGLHFESGDFRSFIIKQFTERDKNLIAMAKKTKIDFVGLSFIRSINDIKLFEEELIDSDIKCIPKIESFDSITNLYEILSYSDLVIVDRGDMAGEIGLKHTWAAQRKILSLAKLLNTRVILATQFFTSMIRKATPSIAEIDSFIDLLNLNIDGIQLSEETAIGFYGNQVVSLITNMIKVIGKNNKEVNDNNFTVWIMGPTGSGKTTIASMLTKELIDAKIDTLHFDGDEVRSFFGSNHGFSSDDRLRVVNTLVKLCKKSTLYNKNSVVSALTAHDNARDLISNEINSLVTVYLDCPIEVCKKRDVKGLYTMAERGEIDTLIGVNSVYKPPVSPDLVIKNDNNTKPDDVVKKIVAYLAQKRIKTFEGNENITN